MKSFTGGSCEVVSGLPIYSSLSETSLSYERPYNLDIMFHIVTFYVLTHHQMFIYSAFEWVMYFSLASNKYRLCMIV